MSSRHFLPGGLTTRGVKKTSLVLGIVKVRRMIIIVYFGSYVLGKR
jgi:hypothetical protein